jgi:hypothetical protein
MGNILIALNKYKNQTLIVSLLLIIVSLLIEQSGRTGVSLILFTLAGVSLLLSYTGFIAYKTIQLHTEIENLLTNVEETKKPVTTNKTNTTRTRSAQVTRKKETQ